MKKKLDLGARRSRGPRGIGFLNAAILSLGKDMTFGDCSDEMKEKLN